MIKRDKMYIIANNIDDSIKSITSVYDITIFKSFVDFEKYVNETPVIISTLVVSGDELPFTNINMVRLFNIVDSPFVSISGNVIYLLPNDDNLNLVSNFLQKMNRDNWQVYQGDLSFKFISDIVSGEGRLANEGQTDIVTYRIRASEYVKQNERLKYESEEDHYISDDEMFEDIKQEEEPIEYAPIIEDLGKVTYIVGDYGYERSLFTFLLAQYYSLSDKTLIVDKDVNYHILLDMVSKSGVDYEFISMQDMQENVQTCLDKIISSTKKLIVVGSVKKTYYDYSFIFELLYNNLKNNVAHFIRECNYEETPYGNPYTIVISNTIPGVLKMSESLQYQIVPKDVNFVGLEVNVLGQANITSKEMRDVLSVVLDTNDVNACTLQARGLLLKGDGSIYDLLGVITRESRR